MCIKLLKLLLEIEFCVAEVECIKGLLNRAGACLIQNLVPEILVAWIVYRVPELVCTESIPDWLVAEQVFALDCADVEGFRKIDCLV